ncbi:MAG: acetyl-coenzyme A synthetase, partial [Candidatus Aminicenantes bacterium]|nr:acetyl-coenzyme A synthetase [Candidatus Aminicenantes bacterium]
MTEEKKQAISTDSLMDEKRTFPPSNEVVERAHIKEAKYKEMYERSVNDPDGFWLEQAETLDWVKKPTVARKYKWDTKGRVIEHTWFEDGIMNVTYNCLDRHLNTPTKD